MSGDEIEAIGTNVKALQSHPVRREDGFRVISSINLIMSSVAGEVGEFDIG